jgi:hypothetical protein
MANAKVEYVETEATNDYSKGAFKLSLLISTVVLLEVLTYKAFFFINPFASSVMLLRVQQTISMLGWIALIVVPPLAIRFGDRLFKNGRVALFLGFILWPLGVLMIRIYLASTTGNPYITYLFNYPIFLFSDVIAPVIYWRLWRNL